MQASIVDLRRRMKDILRALERNETVTILHRGKPKGLLIPLRAKRAQMASAAEHPAVGIWRDNPAVADVDQFVRGLRRGRFDAL